MAIMTGKGQEGPVSEINVTPMVDVMLVLLIIFMIVSWLLGTGIRVDVPKAKNPDFDMRIDKANSAVIAITDDGQIYVNNEPVSLADVPAKITALMKTKPVPEQIVYLKSGAKVKYGTVVSVVNSVRDAGYDRIGLVSKQVPAPATGRQAAGTAKPEPGTGR